MSVDERRKKYRDNIPDMVMQAWPNSTLRRAAQTQGAIEWHPDDLRMPIVGHDDFRWEHNGIVADLKTTERMPSEIKIPHARQVVCMRHPTIWKAG